MGQESEGLSPKEWEEEYSEGTPHWAEDMNPSEFVQDFVQKLEEDGAKTVLEIGCGNGRDSIFLSKAGFRVTAIDVAPSAIELARSNIVKAGEGVVTKVANAEDLPFDNGKFDAVFSLSVLHATDLEKSLPEIYRVLDDDSCAFIYIYGDTQFANGKQKDIIDTDSYIGLLKSVGFTILDFYTESEKGFDEFGEKHKLLVTLLGKGQQIDEKRVENRKLKQRYPTMVGK